MKILTLTSNVEFYHIFDSDILVEKISKQLTGMDFKFLDTVLKVICVVSQLPFVIKVIDEALLTLKK